MTNFAFFLQQNIGGRAKALTVQQQQQAQQRRQQILSPQRFLNTGGLRSDQILRAQKRAQFEQKILRMKYIKIVDRESLFIKNFMCLL